MEYKLIIMEYKLTIMQYKLIIMRNINPFDGSIIT